MWNQLADIIFKVVRSTNTHEHGSNHVTSLFPEPERIVIYCDLSILSGISIGARVGITTRNFVADI